MSEGGIAGRQVDLCGAPTDERLPVQLTPADRGALPAGPEENLGTSTAAGLAAGKEPQAFRTIGEVSRALSLAPHVLRYWEEQFPMLRPVKRSGARRYYRPEDIALLERIDRLVHGEGYTLRGARQLLEAEARETRQASRPAGRARAKPVGDVAPAAPPAAAPSIAEPVPPPAPSADMAKQLRAIRATLADALRAS